MTIILVPERLTFLKLIFKAFWSRFQSHKHLFNIKKRPYFSVLKSRLFSWYVFIVNLVSLHSFKSCAKAFHSFCLKAVIYKKYVLKRDKAFNFRILNLCISLETGALFGKKFMILMAFSCNISFFFFFLN